MVILKGEIWWADLPHPQGSEPAKTRPVLIISGDSFNRSNIRTVICAVLTSNLNLANEPANIRLDKGISKLDRTSVVNFSQIATIDKNNLRDFVSMLPKPYITHINASIKQAFDTED
ncbi:MAG: type II toxin-antitoxin system PemK/MazF family toxin [Spirochaetaceae bacterium]|jgi:mRNA interferase MazF|nr:type II toxin-antitoxin system PemK/MazF family toxin [Spirochaetaceae bacterium]